jgi:GH15 family glucan-1,4-alpha-glucosidase
MHTIISQTEKGSSLDQAAPIADYALISDCNCAALISRSGSVDWCCLPRFDSEPCFGRLLDWQQGGYCRITPTQAGMHISRSYIDDSMVLCTRFETQDSAIQVYDLLTVLQDDAAGPRRRLLRIIEGVQGNLEVKIDLRPRFNFGDIKPWLRRHGDDLFTAVGGAHGLVIYGDMGLQKDDRYSLSASVRVLEGERKHLCIQFSLPQYLDQGPDQVSDMHHLDALFAQTCRWWQQWSRKINTADSSFDKGIRRSAIILKALSYAPTGAIIAAPSTSLPEGLQGTRTWDYRYSWVRDATFTANALVELGCDEEAYRFRRFIERTAAGSAAQLRTLYAVDGGCRQREIELNQLQGYHGARPVRIGNHASEQLQLDALGEMLELSWLWHKHGHVSSEEYWDFLVDLVDHACVHWRDPDHGIWEIRGEPRNYVHSKVMCWSAINRGITLAEELERKAPVDRWRRVREQVHEAVERHGYDSRRGIFVQAFENDYLDAALLRIPSVGFIEYCDARMLRTTDAIHSGLERKGCCCAMTHRTVCRDVRGRFLPVRSGWRNASFTSDVSLRHMQFSTARPTLPTIWVYSLSNTTHKLSGSGRISPRD